MVVIYGEKGLGKTRMINEFCKDKNALYFLATEEHERENRKAFQGSIAELTGDKTLKNNPIVDNWDVLFEILVKNKSVEKLIIVLDEFQNLVRANNAFASIMQRIWDTFLQDSSIMLILCGSDISVMESHTLTYDSPLYGRRTGQIKFES